MFFLIELISVIIQILNGLKMVGGNETRLTAVTEGPSEYVQKLYREEGSEDAPCEQDLAAVDAYTRLRICEGVRDSGVFDETYENIINTFVESSNTTYVQQKFELTRFVLGENHEYIPDSFKNAEYVFLCRLRDKSSNDAVVSFYVSKAYGRHYNRRYVFPVKKIPDELQDIMLAEKAARVYTRPDFNVELHYLELRKYHEPEECYELDPVCKLTFCGALEDVQISHLCTLVLKSSYFEDEIKKLRHTLLNGCYKKNISFKTTEAIEEADGKLYYERMIKCDATMRDSNAGSFYISRAYNPHEIFVYFLDPSNSELYIKNLSIDVPGGFVPERYNLGVVEI